MKSDKIDELANGLDELMVTVDELSADPPQNVDRHDIQTVKDALGRASRATAELEDQTEDE